MSDTPSNAGLDQSGETSITLRGLQLAYTDVRAAQTFDSKTMLMDNSKAGMRTNHGSIMFSPQGARYETVASRSDTIGGHSFNEVRGDSNYLANGDYRHGIGGDVIVRVGEINPKTKKAGKALAQISKDIHQAAIDRAIAVKDEKTGCPVCSQKTFVDQKSKIYIMANKLAYILNEIPYVGTFFKWMAIICKRLAAWLSIKTHAGYMNKGSCGSPGCKNHQVESSAKTIRTYGEQVTSQVETRLPEINQHQIDLGQGGNYVVTASSGIVFNSGLEKNRTPVYINKGVKHVYPAGMQQKRGGSPMVLSSKGCPDKIITTKPMSLTQGDMYFNASEKFTVNAGSPGIHLQTEGPMEIKAGSLDIRASEGELHIGSGNLTVINGKGILFKADDKSGDGTISFDADNVHFHKSASLGANLNVKGHISMDGPLSIPFLNCPGMAQQVTVSKPTQMYTGGSNPSFTGTAARVASFAKDIVGKIAFPPTWILSTDNMMSFATEKYDSIMSAMFSAFPDFRPAGWAMVLVETFGVCSYGGAVYTFGYAIGGFDAPTLFAPVFLYYHNHGMFSMESNGSVTLPLGNYYETVQGVEGVRAVESPIPTPPPVRSKMGERPGERALDGNCGGGGLYYKDKTAALYGVDLDQDGAGQYNFVNRYSEWTDEFGNIDTTNFNLSSDFKPQIKDPDFSYYKFAIQPLSAEDCDPSCPT